MSFRHPPCAGVGRLRLQGKHVKALHEDIPVPWGRSLPTPGTIRSSNFTMSKIPLGRFACGNVVVKPSDVTPLRTCELIQVAGFPPDVVNIVTGYGVKVGEAIARYPRIDKVTSTGLALTGKKIIQTSRETSLKKDTLERISYLMMPTLTKQ